MMRVDEFFLLRVIVKRSEQLFAFLLRHVLDLHRHQAVDVDRLLLGVFVGAEHRMQAFAVGFGALVVAFDDRAVVVVMDGIVKPVVLF